MGSPGGATCQSICGYPPHRQAGARHVKNQRRLGNEGVTLRTRIRAPNPEGRTVARPGITAYQRSGYGQGRTFTLLEAAIVEEPGAQ
jgi:hypothetical protein